MREPQTPQSRRVFVIDRMISEGASCVCYEAHQESGSGGRKGTLKEFYPADYDLYLARSAEGQLVFADDFPEKERFEKEQEEFLDSYRIIARQLETAGEGRLDDAPDGASSISDIAADAAARGVGDDLDLVIPRAEIFRGCREDGALIGTIYIWSAEPRLLTYDRICGEVRRHPSEEPEHKLVTVLLSLEALARGVLALHAAGLIHRDIKPSNFGFRSRGGETLTQTLSLFDINSVCSAEERQTEIMGTPGYLAPELAAGQHPADNQTDIYSIGAVLFQSVIVTKETAADGGRYREEYYAEIPRLVRESELILCSESNSHPRLRWLLSTILNKSLAPRGRRYEYCEDLVRDLGRALSYALPSEISRRYAGGGQWVLDEVRSHDWHQDRNSTLAIQYHLYQVPLVRAAFPPASPAGAARGAGEDAGCVRAQDHGGEKAAGGSPQDNAHAAAVEAAPLYVLLLGFGQYGQKYLDSCLQAGQIRGRFPEVTIITEDETDGECYLSERPALKDFFRVRTGGRAGGVSAVPKEDAYGSITFLKGDLTGGEESAAADPARILRALRTILGSRKPLRRQENIFIALGEDGLNLAAAKACRGAVPDACTVSYVREESGGAPVPEGLHAVDVHEDMSRHPLHGEIERMAWNVHLVWQKSLCVDRERVRAQFLEPYNHDACVANVLSLKHKLLSIGIDPDRPLPAEPGKGGALPAQSEEGVTRRPAANTGDWAEAAAERFLACFEGGANARLREELIWIEHRRWVTEKLCLGWQCMKDLSGTLAGPGKTKDEQKRLHVCIVRSLPDEALADAVRKDPSFWDTATPEQLSGLDELDRLSVDLHRIYAARAGELRKSGLPGRGFLAGIRAELGGSAEAVCAYQEWEACIRDIWNGEGKKTALYDGRRQTLLDAASRLPENRNAAVREQLEGFDRVFYPIRASLECRDWKNDDVALVDSIPFILTYREDVCLVVPARTRAGGSGALLENAAAACVVNPGQIVYLGMAGSGEELERLREAAAVTERFLKKKRVGARTQWLIGTASGIKEKAKAEADPAAGKTEGVLQLIPVRDEADFAERAAVAVSAVAQDGMLVAAEENGPAVSREEKDSLSVRKSADPAAASDADPAKDGGWMELLLRNLPALPRYRFDPGRMCFTVHEGCDLLSRIRKPASITVSDLQLLSESGAADGAGSARGAGPAAETGAGFRIGSGNRAETGTETAGEGGQAPEYCAEYQELWERFRADTASWKTLCAALRAHMERKDEIARFPLPGEEEAAETLRYLLPSACLGCTQKLLKGLSAFGIVGEGSRVSVYGSDTCEILLYDPRGERAAFDDLFRQVYALLVPEALSAVPDETAGAVLVKVQKLAAEDVRIPSGGCLDLLRFLERMGYVIGLRVSGDGTEEVPVVSFTFASRQIRALLTDPGRILRIYAFQRIRELPDFDDVRAGFAVEDGLIPRAAADIIVTKGFRSVFIGFAREGEPDEEAWKRLAESARRYGANAKALCLSDTEDLSGIGERVLRLLE